MLEVKNLVKTYKTKGGVITKALDDVSIVFPEKGMVFLLGKSGSGKSTLLNVVGGLDKPDSGEIIIKGRNSKSFSGADFDSYRNTFIGFIFQEYNILNEFNVEENISLALQLQGKPNDKATVTALLEQVDLTGFGKRHPNTLSGGQKQRVAIARALIKNPEIIMADEPTGALDSNTGKQVFDTLKRLSQEKLVIVVSHDRDFAEYYGDRIIELSDGKVLYDDTKKYVEPKSINENVHFVNDKTVAINDTSKLTTTDMQEILAALKRSNGQAIISTGDHDTNLVRQAIHVNSNNSSEVFAKTEKIEVKEYDPKETKFIRSKLPYSRAFKIGSSSLKVKPGRLIFTSFLTTVALAMFGLTSTLMLFDENYSISQALNNSGRTSETVCKQYEYTNTSYMIDSESWETEEKGTYKNYDKTMMSLEDVQSLNNNTAGLYFSGIYSFNSMSFSDMYTSELDKNYYSVYSPEGFIEINDDLLTHNEFSFVAGELPSNSKEIVISEYFYDVIKQCNTDINTHDDLIGKKLKIGLYCNGSNINYEPTVSGILNVGTIASKYDAIKDNYDSLSPTERSSLVNGLKDLLTNSYYTFIYVNEDFYDDIYYPLMGTNSVFSSYESYLEYYVNGISLQEYPFDENGSYDDPNNFSTNFREFSNVKENTNKYTFYDLNGEKTTIKDTLGDYETYIPYSNYKYAYINGLNNYLYKANELSSKYSFAEEINTYFTTGDNYQNFIHATTRLSNYSSDYIFNGNYTTGYDFTTDYNYVKHVMDTYYKTMKEVDYTLECIVNYFNLCDTYGCVDSELEEIYSKYQNAISSTPYDLTNLSTLKEYLLTDPHDIMTTLRMFEYFNKINNVPSEINDLIITAWNTRLTSSEVEQIKTCIEENYNGTPIYTYTTNDLVAEIEINVPTKYYFNSSITGMGTLNVVGFYEYGNYSSGNIVTKNFIKTNGTLEYNKWYTVTSTEYKASGDARFTGAISKSTYTKEQIDVLRTVGNYYKYEFSNDIYMNIIMFLDLISVLKKVFLIIGIVFGVFAALMLFNFISTSINNKIREIGILRAVGARGSDLFKIFFTESGIIGIICSVIAIASSIGISMYLNNYMVQSVGLAMLDFGIINIAMILGGALLIVFVGTIIPVIKAAKKPPVESIRTL